MKDATVCSGSCRAKRTRTQTEAHARAHNPEPDRALNQVSAADSGPLSVYSPARWASLQAKGYIWHEDSHRAYLPATSNEHTALSINGQPVIMGVTVPGDPAYKGSVKAA